MFINRLEITRPKCDRPDGRNCAKKVMSKLTSLIDQQIGARVRLRRETLGLDTAQLSAAIGVSAERLGEYEAGATRVPAAHMQKLAEVLLTPVTAFFGPPTLPGEPPRPSAAGSQYEEERQLLRIFMSIEDPAARRSILDHAARVADAADRARKPE